MAYKYPVTEDAAKEIGDKVVNAIMRVANAVDKKSGVIYGFHLNGAESDPDKMITYLEDAVGMTPAHMDFTNDRFDYGSWENAFFMPKPCMVKYSGERDYYLNPNDYSKKEDGSASDVANTSYAGNAMVEWPKIYWKIVPDSNPKSASIFISDHKADPDFHCWSNINCKGDEIDYFYTPIYNGTIVDSKLRSISGLDYTYLCQSKTASQEVDLAEANNLTSNVLWYTETQADNLLITFLLVLISKTTASHKAFGEGRRGQASAASSMIGTGTMNTKGMFWGSNTTTYGVKVFHMENFWSNQWRRGAGLVMVNGIIKFKLTWGMQDGSTVEGYQLSDFSGYITANSEAPSGTNGGYISQMLFTEKGMFMQVVSGSSSTYFCDGGWFNNSGTMYAIRGGAAAYDEEAGLFSLDLYDTASNSYWSVGAAVSCKPLAA